MKKLSALLLSSAVLLSATAQVDAEGNTPNILIYIDGQLQQFEQNPVIDQDFTLVPLRGIFEELGAKVEWDGQTKKITATKETTRIVMTVGSNSALKNGTPVKLDAKPKIINGRTMVPLRFVSEVFGSEVKWDGTNKRIDINQKASENNSLTFEQALVLAEKNSVALKKAIVDIERSDEVRENAADNLNYTPIGTGNGPDDAQERAVLKGVQQANVGLQLAKKNVETLNDSLNYKVRKAYDEILQKQKDKQLAEMTLNNAITQEHLTNVKVENGLASQFDQLKAQSTFQEAKEKQGAAIKALEDAQQKFNQLLGIENGKIYEFVDSTSFEQLKDINLEDHVKKVIADNPSLWSLEKQIDLAQLDVDLYTFNTGSNLTPYEAEELDVTKAKLTLSETKQTLEQSVRTMYYNIRQLENQLGILNANLAKAEQGLKMIQAKYDVGMAIEAELSDAALSVEQLKKQIFDITIQHEQLKMAFEKPWVLTGN